MTVPAAVRAQAEEANRQIRLMSGETIEETTQQEASEVAEVEEPEAAEMPAEEANEITDLSENQHEEISRQEVEEGQEETPEEEAPEIEPETPQIETSELEEWKAKAEKAEARYKTLQGKYNKEIKALSSQDKPKVDNSEIVTLKNEIDSLKKQLKQKASNESKSSEKADAIKRLKDEYEGQFIDDLLLALSAGSTPDLSDIEEKLAAVQEKQKQSGDESHSAKTMILSGLLKEKGIDWQQMDSDPLFHDWLSKYDQETGIQRNSSLIEAFKKGDLSTTAAFYEDYARANGILTSNKAPAKQPKVNFKNHVKPETKAPRTPNKAAAPEYIWTPQAIQSFYNDKRKGRFSAAEAARLEREIFSAQ